MMQPKEISKTEYFIGRPTSSQWSSVYFYSPHIPATFEEKGEIFAVISLSGPTSFDCPRAGDLLLDQLHEQYFESQEESILISLERAVLSVKKRLLELLQNDEQSSTEGIDLSLLAMVVKKKISYIVKMGEAKLLGERDGDIQEISSVLKDPDGRGEIKVGSFRVQETDTFLLTTPHGRLELSDEELETTLKDFSLSKISGMHFDVEALSSFLLVSPFVDKPTLQVAPKYEKEDYEYEEEVLEEEGDEIIKPRFDYREQLQNVKNTFGNISSKFKNVNFDYAKNAKTFQVILVNTFGKVWKGLKWLGSYIYYDLLKMDQSSGLYLKGKGHTRSINWRLIVFVSVILIVGGYYLIKTVQSNKKKAALELAATTQLDQISQDVTQLTDQTTSLVATREREDEKSAILAAVMQDESALGSITLFPQRVEELRTKLKELERKLERKIEIKDIKILKDFGVIEGTNLSDLDVSDNNIFVSDAGNGFVYSFDFTGGEMKRLADGLDGVKTISMSKGGTLIFVDNNSDRAIGSINPESSTINRFQGMSPGRLGNLKEIDAYRVTDGDDRIYGVRKESKEVIQMKKSGSTYGFPEMRLNGNNLSNLLDIDIDEGRIYLVSQGQGVRRFNGQEEKQNNIKGMVNNDNWNDASAISVDERYVYLVDNSNKRILVFTKYRSNDATILDFVAQYDLSKISNYEPILDIASSRKVGKLYAVTSSKVFELNLSDLREFGY